MTVEVGIGWTAEKWDTSTLQAFLSVLRPKNTLDEKWRVAQLKIDAASSSAPYDVTKVWYDEVDNTVYSR